MAEAQSTNEETLTENLAFAEVLAWSATRPAWQRDALRRLVQSGILGSEEIDELLEICLDPALPMLVAAGDCRFRAVFRVERLGIVGSHFAISLPSRFRRSRPAVWP